MKKYIFFEKEGQLAYTVIDEKSTNILTDIQNKYKFIIINDKFPSDIYIEFFKAYYIHGSEIRLNLNIAKDIYLSILNTEIQKINNRLDELEYRYIMEPEQLNKINSVRSELNVLLNNIDLSNISSIKELIKVRPIILDIYEELLK